MIFSSRPSKQDIRQFEMFTLKGLNQNDIEEILGITSAEFNKWKLNKEIDRIAKLRPKQDPERFNMNHVSLSGQTEFAFESGLIKFYRFKEEYRMPIGRYKYVYKRFKESDMRMSVEVIGQYLDAMESNLNGSKKTINISPVIVHINAMRSWLKIPFEPEAVRKLSAVTYFTEDEDLSTFDEKYGEWKIELWRKNNTHDFFLTRPIGELLNLSDSSLTYLEEYLKEIQPILTELTLGLPKSSSDAT